MAQQFFNNFDTTLTVQLNSGALSMTVNDASGLPVTLGGGNSYLLTLSDGPVETLWEIILVDTDRAGNVIAITSRAQEGGADLTWPIGTFVSGRVTAATMDAAIAGGGGGGGSGTELLYDRNLFWNTVPGGGSSVGEWYYSPDGGYSWRGDRWDNFHGLAGGDIEDPKIAHGSGINCKGLTLHGTSFD